MRKFIIIMVVLLLVSCTTTKYVEVPVETIKTEYINKVQYDSIYIHDSIDRYISNDTVYLSKYKYLDKYILRVDTVLKVDTIPVTVYVDKPIPTKVSFVEQLKGMLTLFAVLGVSVLIGLIFILLKKVRS